VSGEPSVDAAPGHTAEVDAPPSVQPIDPRRRLGALSEAIAAELRRAERSGGWVAIAVFAGVVAVLVLLSRAVPELGWLREMPSWLVAVLLGFGASLASTVVSILIVPRRVIDGWTALTWIAVNGQAEWRRRTGDPYPESVAAMERWLAGHPETNGNRLDRATLLLALDRPGDVERELAAYSPDGRDHAFLGAQLRWFAAFMGERAEEEPLLDQCRELSFEYPTGSRDRRVAEAAISHLAASRAFAFDGAWLDRLAESRRALGPLARGVTWRYLLPSRLLLFAVVGTVVAGVLMAAQLIGGL
jgi:hypothetical protein